MPQTPQKFYLTTPIYYVNARPHIGHAYSTIAADVIARRHRLLGDDTFFLTGTDEHGQKVQRSAEKAGIPPQQFTDEVSATFRNLWARMGITNDDYIRTTEERHKRGVQKLWRVLEERGAIYLSTYTGQYSVGEEMFVEGPPGTIGPDGKPTETVTEENYFFRLSDYQEMLINLIEDDDPNAPLRIQPSQVRNEVLSFLRGNPLDVLADEKIMKAGDLPETAEELQKAVEVAIQGGGLKRSNTGKLFVPGALKDLSISRTTFNWGIPVPKQSGSSEQDHVVYVWLDALVNYITAIGYGSDDPADQAKFAKYWPADVHLVGKEITRFHCVYWPAFLMAAGLPTPKAVVANGWLLFEESKMSKSRGNVVRTETILDAFGDEVYGKQFPESAKNERDLFASDVIRYFLLREIPFGQDGSFSFDALITRYNADLANGYGNLVSRTLTMLSKYFDAAIPSFYLVPGIDGPPRSCLGPPFLPHDNVERSARRVITDADALIEASRFSSYLELCGTLIKDTDEGLSRSAPWKELPSADQTRDHRSLILYTAAESIRIITALLYPVMPYATASVWRQLGLGDIEEAARNGELKNLEWGGLKPGTKLGPLAPIFPRADKGLAQIMTDMENSTTPATPGPAPTATSPEPTAEALAAVNPATDQQATPGPNPPLAPEITIDDFAKVDLRVAQILVAERIPKADKLLRLEVDLGYEKRQILAGIAEYYAPETLIGRRVVIVANLAPRKMRGLESNGMIVAASIGPQGAPVLTGFLEDVELGARLK